MSITRPPSMADVAAAAGVSHQTVSRVLNGHAYVKDDTRERVQAAIRSLGYRRNQAARTLVTTRSATIGVVATGMAHHGPASTVLAIEQAARRADHFVSLAAMTSRDADAAAHVLDRLIDQGVDGIVVVAPTADVARRVDEVAPQIPVVVVAARRDAPSQSAAVYVAVDQYAGSARVAEHLADLGHERAVHIEGPAGWFDAIERSRGFADAAECRGVAARVVHADDWGAEHGYAAGTSLVQGVESGEVTAVFAASDHLALGAIRAFWEAGIRVPDDVSVVGFDDVDGSGFFVPSLTTVHQPFDKLGDAAVRRLLAQRDASATTGEPMIDPEVIVRGSTAPPRR
ncbi:MAG: LacI family DNA-binding transcriptional regulator [Microbacterium gubbeenense]|uniref:LacI family DNA-binding transcriptional regulator n=2 Tax=Microbacterium gubbeenense TaxID=159896 RepID=UPI003F9D8C20